MDSKTIIEIIVGVVTGILGIIGVTVHIVRKKDSNKIKNLNQQALSKDKVYQAGRDINVR
ncbi:hypothetical protein [Clostridium botulinum]|uniref:hypothetical protein n=1 Tax=Clostridium botulinum TaxID=1491 RepID=UPI001966D7C4|nr:hypothetical protein [Clostridium botulinum]MBN1077741.1 hypothetical protein [Clostridium botulinum]